MALRCKNNKIQTGRDTQSNRLWGGVTALGAVTLLKKKVYLESSVNDIQTFLVIIRHVICDHCAEV